MPRRKKETVEPQQEERWVSVKVAHEILQRNNPQHPIDRSYVRSLARTRKDGKPPIVASRKAIGGDDRTKEYRLSDLENYVVKPRDKAKGDTRAARLAGNRPKSAKVKVNEQVEQAG